MLLLGPMCAARMARARLRRLIERTAARIVAGIKYSRPHLVAPGAEMTDDRRNRG
jgi:hypothetical protein